MVTEPSTDSSANVPRIAIIPIARGSSAAMTLPNAITSSVRMIGTAIPSAVPRLLKTCLVMSLPTAALPPTVTSTCPLCELRLANSDELRLRSLLVLPRMSAYLPSFDLRPGLCVCQ